MARELLGLIQVVTAALVVLVVRALRPVLLIRMAQLRSERIGHFALSTELYLCERDVGVQRRGTLDIFFHASPVCNQQLKKMWDRTLRVSSLANLPFWINRFLPGNAPHEVPIPPDRDIHGLLARTPVHLSFTPDEESRGIRELGEFGVADGDQFVCFIARDSAYLESVLPGLDWSYHDFRNSDVKTYLPALESLSERGCYSIRMGAIVNGPMPTSSSMIIDYAHKFRTDFMDIYLSAKCKFFLTSSTGIDGVSMIFRRPLAVVNYIPLEQVWTWVENGLFILKRLYLEREQRFLTFREILESGVGRYDRSDLYKQDGITVIGNTPDEIMDLVVEMDERLSGTWQTSEEDEQLQRQFADLFKSSSLHGHIAARVGAKFLRQNRDLLI